MYAGGRSPCTATSETASEKDLVLLGLRHLASSPAIAFDMRVRVQRRGEESREGERGGLLAVAVHLVEGEAAVVGNRREHPGVGRGLITKGDRHPQGRPTTPVCQPFEPQRDLTAIC